MGGGRKRERGQDDGCIRIICNRNLCNGATRGRRSRPLGAAVFRVLRYLDRFGSSGISWRSADIKLY